MIIHAIARLLIWHSFWIRRSCRRCSRNTRNTSSTSTLPWTTRVLSRLHGLPTIACWCLSWNISGDISTKLSGLTTGLSFQSSISSGTGLDSSSQDRFWPHLPCYGDNCICHNWLASHDIHGIHGWYFYFFAGCLFGGWPCAGQGCKGTGMHYITATVFNKTPNLLPMYIFWNGIFYIL